MSPLSQAARSAGGESPRSVAEELYKLLSRKSCQQTPQWFEAVGCKQCQHTGYRGRLGIYEIATVTDTVSDMVLHQKPLHEIHDVMRKTGFRGLMEDGLLKAWQGETSVEEVLRVTGQAGIDEP